MEFEVGLRGNWFMLQLEKDKADELSRQMAMQTQALMEERAAMKAEKDELERSHNEMAARLQLLEGMMTGPEPEDYDFQAEEEAAMPVSPGTMAA